MKRSEEIAQGAAESAAHQPPVADSPLARTPTADELAQVEHDFKYHKPTPEQIPLYAQINAAAKELALTLLRCCPPSADRSAALRKIREARMTANASIALYDDATT